MRNFVDERVYKIARRLHLKKKLELPVPIEDLVREHAELHIVNIPFDVDGLCLDLKIPGKRPKVFVKAGRNARRIRFTLAHELGHILIPWHAGHIIDDIGAENNIDFYYGHMEKEANEFASELLIPQNFVQEIVLDGRDIKWMIEEIVHECDVSVPAAFIRLPPELPQNHIICMWDVTSSAWRCSRSPGTRLSYGLLSYYAEADEEDLPNGQRTNFSVGPYKFVHWQFPDRFELPLITDERDWRAVLDEALSGFVEEGDVNKLKQSLNGLISYINSALRNSADEEQHYAQFVHRISSDPYLSPLLERELFHQFAIKRFQEMIRRKKEKLVISKSF
jgi:Zn-dependent peptidase ImmA (M78 family)